MTKSLSSANTAARDTVAADTDQGAEDTAAAVIMTAPEAPVGADTRAEGNITYKSHNPCFGA
jgi:hypothetical protein